MTSQACRLLGKCRVGTPPALSSAKEALPIVAVSAFEPERPPTKQRCATIVKTSARGTVSGAFEEEEFRIHKHDTRRVFTRTIFLGPKK